MADPLALLIFANVKSTLEGIARPTYHRDVNRVKTDGALNWRSDPDAILLTPPVGMPAAHEPVAYTRVTMTLALVCLVHDSNDILAAMFKFSSDVVKALSGTRTSRTRGGYAHDTLVTNQFRNPFLASDDPSRGAFGMDVQIMYDHTLYDPDTVIGG